MPKSKFNIALTIYIIVGIYTFGDAFNSIECKYYKSLDYVSCEKRDIASLLAAIAWPMYWSVELQE